jgi:DNA-binding MarR family transcriptional regulator
LESKGLIQRERCSNDRRLVYLELTERGRELYPTMREISRRVLNRFLRGFSREEAGQLEGYLRRMLANA